VRTALFSDVHGNAVAFDAFIADLDRHPADRVVCLGDVIQGGTEPAACIERLRLLDCPVVMGNADWYVLRGETAEPETDHHRAMREWTMAQLSSDDIEFMRGFQPGVELPGLLAFHGSPGSFDEIILPSTPEDEFRRALDGADAPVLAGGHVHLQYLRRRGDSLFVNPGSVGLAYDHEQLADDVRFDAWAQYAVVSDDGTGTSVEFRRVAFDREAVIDSYRTSGAPGAERAAAWQSRG
jgi:predicted phosphodiesterase